MSDALALESQLGVGSRCPQNITVFGTVHQIQGAEKASWRQIEDPEYVKLVNRFLGGKDFVFEEASELGPTKAERLTDGPGARLPCAPLSVQLDNCSVQLASKTGHFEVVFQ